MPCNYLTLDAMDMSGELQLDLAHNVFKKRFKDGIPIGVVREELSKRVPQQQEQQEQPQPPNNSSVPSTAVSTCGSCYGAQTRPNQCCNTCEEVREAYRVRGWAFTNPESISQCQAEGFSKLLEESRGEGCQVYGYLLVNKVAGNFHFSPGKSFQAGGAHVHDYALFKQTWFNMTHTVSSLSFGQQFPGIVNPLDGVTKIQTAPVSRLYQYYIKVVPTRYQSLAAGAEIIRTNQYSVTEHDRELGHEAGHGLPGVFFMYDLSPITVQYSETKQSFAHFLTSLCAIIGGVFTIASFVDALVYHGARAVRRKVTLGKFF